MSTAVDTSPAIIGVQRCGCITYARAGAVQLDREDERALARIVREGGQVITTTVDEAKRLPHFLEPKCPHDPPGWQPVEEEPKDRIRYQRVRSRNVSRVRVVIEPHTVAGASYWPRGISGGEVGKRDGKWWATPGWFSSTTNEATDGKDPRGLADVLGPFDRQRDAAEALIPYAERFAAEIAGVASSAFQRSEARE